MGGGSSKLSMPIITRQEAMESFAFPDDLLIDEHLEAVDGFMLFWLMLY